MSQEPVAAPLQPVEYLYGSAMLRPLRLAYGLAPLIAVLEHHGAAVAPLLEAARIPRFALEEPSYRIRFEQELAFIRSALASLNLPTAGLEVGQQYNLALFGVLGLAASCAPTVRELFRTVPSFPVLCWGSIEQAVWRDGSDEYVAFYANDAVGDCATFFIERDITAVLCLFRQTLGEHVRPVSVRFARPAPPDREPYERFFACPISYADAVNQIRFESSVWNAEPPQANPMAYRYFINQCRQLSDALEAPLRYAEVVRTRLRLAPRIPTFEALTADLQLSRRSLQRRLAEEGTSYSALLAEVRTERAIEMIARGGMPNEEIARCLGFADGSAFSRAFASWTGRSPSAYRKQRD